MSSFILHLIAFTTMFLDHMWHTNIVHADIFNYIGRLAFPIFAFMIVEGFFHTSNRKKYMIRMLIFALISEIPFNLMVYRTIFAPAYQNVLWTFLISMMLMYLNEKLDKKDNAFKTSIIMFGTMIVGGILGILFSSDYGAGGVLTVLTFYYFREKKWSNYLIQLAIMIVINLEMLGSSRYIMFDSFAIPGQIFAILSLVFIWLYNGKQGPYNKVIKNIYWLFYPVHMCLLVAIAYFI